MPCRSPRTVPPLPSWVALSVNGVLLDFQRSSMRDLPGLNLLNEHIASHICLCSCRAERLFSGL